MCEGLRPDGKLFTLDINEELEEMVRGYFERSGYASRIEYILGNAHEVIPGLDETFDMVFIDVDKKGYADYFDLAIGKVRSGGILTADNVLSEGKVVTAATDKENRNMQEFNEQNVTDERVENIERKSVMEEKEGIKRRENG